MGLLITTYANLVNVWKTSGEAGKQRVNESLFFTAKKVTTVTLRWILKAMMKNKRQRQQENHHRRGRFFSSQSIKGPAWETNWLGVFFQNFCPSSVLSEYCHGLATKT